ncbi:uncharacterized protein EI90DRAFT_3060052 [Cantharellus anzutake]|uniref:uncharacterized protein n=1 Tax=Cantharellus anzutake TaxID=1750568 RepID=UPI0019054622|nr:uncharacterized protein EI90DRAFT_3060052 [Cantharellus anzutake]KAF8330584.1 hypothetical protein EI90DRAFT_3060052 [Cantharellus anzutake]
MILLCYICWTPLLILSGRAQHDPSPRLFAQCLQLPTFQSQAPSFACFRTADITIGVGALSPVDSVSCERILPRVPSPVVSSRLPRSLGVLGLDMTSAVRVCMRSRMTFKRYRCTTSWSSQF